MNSAPGNALELALALLRAPGERHGLRGRPLPLGVDRLLAIAARVDPAENIQETARLHGVAPSLLVEAAQFYAREILFHPQADAYRVLGVMPDASPEQVKAHHRLLQMWLHPDRQRDVDDTVFAARVNVAWNCIRNESRRRKYDERRAADARLQPAGPASVPPRVAPVWISPQEDAGDGAPWRSRWPFMALLGVCLLLGWLAARNNERQPEAWNFGSDGTDLALGKQEGGGRLLAVQEPVAAQRPAHPPPHTRANGQEQRTARRQVVAGNGQTARGRETSPAPPNPVIQRLPKTSGEPEPAGASSRMVASVTQQAEAKVEARPAVRARPVGEIRVVARELRPGDARQEDMRTAGLGMGEPRAAKPALPEIPVPQTVASIATQAAPSEPGILRIQQARRVGDSLLKYLATRGRVPPPIWNSPGVMSRASGLRDDLHASGRPRIGVPQWRIQNVSAALTSRFEVEGSEGRGGQGIVTARMTWREDRWLVSELGVERAR